jgi:hypothetical protein
VQPRSVRRTKIDLVALLASLHRYGLKHGGDGNPLPVVVGDTVYHDPVDLAEALADDDEETLEVPDDSLARLEAGVTLYGTFAQFNGFDGIDCADGSRVRVRCVDDGADECMSFGILISLVGDAVEIEPRALSDGGGECVLDPLLDPKISGRISRWVRTFLISQTKRTTK